MFVLQHHNHMKGNIFADIHYSHTRSSIVYEEDNQLRLDLSTLLCQVGSPQDKMQDNYFHHKVGDRCMMVNILGVLM